MPVSSRTTPGVYINQPDEFPPAIVGVQTAVPAFIGYTKYAEIDGQPAYNKAIQVGSLAEFERYFGTQFETVYDLIPVKPSPKKDNYDFTVEWAAISPPVPPPVASPPGGYFYYYLQSPPNAEFNLYYSMRLFYANHGANCYVVSVGSYDMAQQSGGINATDLIRGLNVIRDQVGPTMLVVPDAVLLPANSPATAKQGIAPVQTSSQYDSVVQAMLEQSYALQDRVAILDVYSTLSVQDETTLQDVVSNFWTSAGVTDGQALSYGMAYFPFLHTNLAPVSETTYLNLAPLTTLQQILYMESQNLYGDDPGKLTQVNGLIGKIGPYDPATDKMSEVTTLNQNLVNAIPLLANIEQVVVEKNSVLPPSAAVAGVYTESDGTRGVWNSPANIALIGVTNTTYKLNDDQQGALNVPLNGMAINVLRDFVGRGTVVWGARTLSGNSSDWRYIQVRRTIIYIQQSVKNALASFVFAPNTDTTWVTVTALVSSFLADLWATGGLMGDKASDAFTVQCGLGSTMTGQDILSGYLIVQVTLQMIRPGEYIELTFKQKVEGVS